MRALVALGLLAPLFACGANSEANDLLDQIQADDYRSTYARAPGWENPRQPADGGPHGSFIDIYVNDVVVDALEAGGPLEAWPEGSLIVKDGFSDAEGQNLRFVTLMEKRSGGDWFWAEFNSDLEIDFAGLNEGVCVSCHDAGADGVLAFDLPQ